MTFEFLFNTCAAIDAMYWVSSVNVTNSIQTWTFQTREV